MHGLIFTSFLDFLAAEHGDETADFVFKGEPPYLLSEVYDDERLTALVEQAANATNRDAGDVLEAFGVYAALRTFAGLYPAWFATCGSAREFLLTIEPRIHELVRATVRHAAPPQLHVTVLGDAGVGIVYTSPRRLCRLLRGLAEGTARYYGERTSIEETACMLRGADACRFAITLFPAPPS